ncbi:unnamed protein product, partial [Darwinula stevensoni]
SVDFCHVASLPGLSGDIQRVQSNGRVWRFLPMMDPLVDIFVSRDSDSPLSEREAAAVKEWLESKYIFHAMRDHPHHWEPAFAGLWGAKVSQNRGHVQHLGRKLIFESGRSNNDGWDQQLLKNVLWPEAHQDFLVHASFHCDKFGDGETRAFPTRRPGGFWLGSGTRHPPIFDECPLNCRPKEHPDWTTC